MKLKFYYILPFLILTSCYQVERNCKDYKTGTFYSEVIIGDNTYKSNFTRTEDLQVEIYKGKSDSTIVRWLNDCEMIYKTINPKNMAERKDIHLKILTTTDSSYTFEYSYVGETNKQKGVAYKRKVNLVKGIKQLSQGRFYHIKDSLAEIEIKGSSIVFLYDNKYEEEDVYRYKISEKLNRISNSNDQFLTLVNQNDTIEYYLEGNSKEIISMTHKPSGRLHVYEKNQ